MHVDLDNTQHTLTMINGFEDLKLRNTGSSDAKYFQTVLKLNGTDLTKISGQEGFAQAIKEGGKKLLEMLMNFLRGIKEFFFGSKSGKSDAAVSKVNTEITKSVIVIKAAPNAKLDQLLEEARASSAKLTSILSGEFGSIRFTSYDEFWGAMTETTSASYRKLDLTGLSITQLGNAEGYKHDKLRTELEKLIKMIREHADGKTNDDSVIALLKTVEDGQRMSALLGSVRTEAKKLIVTMTADLEIATKGLERNKQFVGKDENLTKQHDRLETYTIQLGKSIARLVKLNKDCEKYIFNIAAVCVNMAAKVSENSDASAKTLADFEELMMGEGDLKL